MNPLCSHPITRSRILAAALLAPLAGLLRSPRPAEADYGCDCVTYVRSAVQSQYGNDLLPYGPTWASGYTESFMNANGWYRVKPANTPTNNYIPADGAVMVMDAGAKGADNPQGHMAMVRGNPTYNYSTGRWAITVDEVNWYGNCNLSRDSVPLPGTNANWGDLYGINFYKPNGW